MGSHPPACHVCRKSTITCRRIASPAIPFQRLNRPHYALGVQLRGRIWITP
jgi:hypothetical protein